MILRVLRQQLRFMAPRVLVSFGSGKKEGQENQPHLSSPTTHQPKSQNNNQDILIFVQLFLKEQREKEARERKERLEKEAREREEKETEKKERLEKEAREREEKEKEKKEKKIIYYLGICGFIVGVFGFVLKLIIANYPKDPPYISKRNKILAQSKQQLTSTWDIAVKDNDYQFLEQYLHQKDLMKQNSTRKQLLEHIKRNQSPSTFRVLTGLPGCGKTTELRKIVDELRKDKGNTVLYVNLRQLSKREDAENSLEGANNIIERLEILMRHFYFIKPKKGKKVYFFIDDINILEKLESKHKKDTNLRQRIFELELQFSGPIHLFPHHLLMGIASSDTTQTFYRKNNDVEKGASFSIVQNKTEDERKKCIKSILDFNYVRQTRQDAIPQKYKTSVDYLLKQNYSLRQVVHLVIKLRFNQSDDQFLSELKNQDEIITKQKKKQIINKFEQAYPTFDNLSLKKMESYSKVLQIISKLGYFDGNDLMDEQLLKERENGGPDPNHIIKFLANMNMTFFSYPRTARDKQLILYLKKIIDSAIKNKRQEKGKEAK